MKNKNNCCAVVEDIWINTHADNGDDRPAEWERPTNWGKLEQENSFLIPDPAIPDRG